MNGSLLGTTLRVRAQRLAVCGITLLAVAQARVATILAAEYPRLSSTSVALLPDKELPRPSSPSAAPFTFSNTGSLTTGRQLHTATLLTNGKVLVAAGASAFSVVSSAELYDPATGSWSVTGSLAIERRNHTATLLPNGTVLVVGGWRVNSTVLSSAELYDPVSGTWVATGSLNTARYSHTATLLPNGKVLVAGGDLSVVGGNSPTASAELYDPATGTWSATGSLNFARYNQTATLLPDGKVLVAGGQTGSGYLTSAELYDPAGNGGVGAWSNTGSLTTARSAHTATVVPSVRGRVVVAGGFDNSGALTSAELYDSLNGSWSALLGLNTARGSHTATLLPNGTLLAAGGQDNSSAFASAEVRDGSGTWSATGSLNNARQNHTATLLPGGRILVVGGVNNSGALSSAELYEPANGSWTGTGSLNSARDAHSATFLSTGQVLVAGGFGTSDVLTSAELYDAVAGSWSNTGSLNTARYYHTATLLPNGKVLAVGGLSTGGGILQSSELYDAGSGTWSVTGTLNAIPLVDHTATLLANGKVLVAGGSYGGQEPTNSAQLYDPTSGSWTFTGVLNHDRQDHTATLLPNGKVLVAGGFGEGIIHASTELYNPANGSWAPTGNLNAAREFASATLLPNGKVLLAGGIQSGGIVATAELYDPANGTWTITGNLNVTRYTHTATLLPNGKVLVIGGLTVNDVITNTAELYDPASGTWTPTASLGTGRTDRTATLLPNGKLLSAGGRVGNTIYSIGELYDPGLGFARPDWQPQIASAPSSLILGSSLTLTGSRFKGISPASGGTSQDSPTNYPVVQLRRLDNEQVAFLSTQGWSDSSSTSATRPNFSAGPALITVFTNGIPSNSQYLLLQAPPPLVLSHASSFAYHVMINPFPNPPTFLPFEINLPLSGSPGVECRFSDGPNSSFIHNIFFYFPNNIASTTNATVSCGSVTFRGSNGNPISVEFDGTSCNQQYVTVTLTGIQDSYGQTLPSASVVIGLLLGDVNGDRTVNSADATIARNASGQTVNATNFRADVNIDTAINSADATIVRNNSGQGLPSPPPLLPVGKMETAAGIPLPPPATRDK